MMKVSAAEKNEYIGLNCRNNMFKLISMTFRSNENQRSWTPKRDYFWGRQNWTISILSGEIYF